VYLKDIRHENADWIAAANTVMDLRATQISDNCFCLLHTRLCKRLLQRVTLLASIRFRLVGTLDINTVR
jgi:hypothetical protein